jgi:hypothetical protein
VSGGDSLALRSLDDVERLAKIACASGLVAVKRPEEAAVILLTGRELGLSPMQALRGIYVVNGKPVLSADLLVAVVRRSGLCASWRAVESTAERCTIATLRVGETEPATRTWTMADAKRAGVAGKPIWSQYPAAMLRHRCAADLAREVYPDVVLGLYDPEELGGVPRDVVDTSATKPVEVQVVEPAPEADPERDAIQAEASPLAVVLAAIERVELPGEAVGVWLSHRDARAQMSAADRATAWEALCARTETVGKMQNAKVWLRRAIAEEDARRQASEVTP